MNPVTLLVFLVLTAAAVEPNRRRRIRKKIVVAADAGRNDLETQVEAKTDQQMESKDKAGRGFLDDYYSKFESRTEKVSSDARKSNEIVLPRQQHPLHLPGEDNLLLPKPVQQTSFNRQHDQQTSFNRQHDQREEESQISFKISQPAGDVRYSSGNQGSSDRRSDAEGQLYQLKEQEQQLLQLLSRESELSNAEKEQLLQQLELWEQHRAEFENAQYRDAEHSLQAEITGSRHEKSIPLAPSPFQGYTAEVVPTSLTGPALKDDYAAPGYDETRSTYSSSGSSGVTKYFGLTGTTSHDIQLGLTFTVPFLSIPLTSINDIIGGNFGDIGNLLDFGSIDTTSIVTFIVIAGASVFILPQAIYWLTGINLSSFNWGRSEDDAGGLVALANTVDAALQEFNIDSRGCVAKTLCSSVYEEDETSSFLMETIGKSAIKNPGVKAFLGPVQSGLLEKVDELAATKGTASTDFKCDSHFRGTCPWDPSGVTSIIMKLMESQGTNLAELALKTVAAASS